MNRQEKIETIIPILQQATKPFALPLIDQLIEEFGEKDPFMILIACLLSLRVKDLVTIHVCRDLFSRIRTPSELVALPREELERIVFRTGFYRNKARVLHEVSATLLEKYDGKVPADKDELLGIRGIGLKTAHLVMGMAFGIPAICVDTHVHRISNRLGLITTKTVEQTEQALKKLLPEKHWILWNTLLVVWGQNICVPISPKCSQCPIRDYCDRAGVLKSR